MSSAVEVIDVSKRFTLSHERPRSVKERFVSFRRSPTEEFWALRDVSLDIREGETFGLLGHNGSGKSTLLKCIAGILRPTSGRIHTVGRVAAMLELGTGFHPDLTGRENVYLNASILGLTRREIDRRFDAIVEFAELEHFIDQRVQHYSSGMYVRLGFAVAVHMEPELLLIDEVLAVGDEAFQNKCLARIRQFREEGRTIILVTHNADTVPQVCDRAGVLDHGELIMTGDPGRAIRVLRERLFHLEHHDDPDAETGASRAEQGDGAGGEAGPGEGGAGEAGPAGSPARTVRDEREVTPSELALTDVFLRYPEHEQRPYLVSGEGLDVEVHYDAREPIDDVVFSIAIYDQRAEQLFGTNTDMLGVELPTLDGPGTVHFRFDEIALLDGEYYVSLKAADHAGGTIYDWRVRQSRFEVVNPGRSVGKVHLPVRFEVERPQAGSATPSATRREAL